MILLPMNQGFVRLRRAPVTWGLFAVNLLVFMVLLGPAIRAQRLIEKAMKNDGWLIQQGAWYAEFVLDHKHFYSGPIRELAERHPAAGSGNRDNLKLLGTLALRDSEFLEQAHHYPFQGDRVELRRWRTDLQRLRAQQISHPSHWLGLTVDDQGFVRWLSYIFAHSGLGHFLGNMFFLFIFGAALEPVVGGLVVLFTFLGSGVVGALVFLTLSGASAVPLIGASGAVSGLMALFGVIYGRTPVRYFYVLLPTLRYMGFVFLPAWLGVLLFFMADLAGYYGSIKDFGGVAYAAHLGGQMAGVLVGLAVFASRWWLKKPWPPLAGAAPVVGRMMSLTELIEFTLRPKTPPK